MMPVAYTDRTSARPPFLPTFDTLPSSVTIMSDTIQPDSPWIVNVTPDSFERDVFEKSRETVVVVDFWAAWCAPCRLLAPVLESLARTYDGKFTLVKANTDEVPEAATHFQVQGIPAVFGVVDGQVVDFFTGVVPETQIRDWLERLFTIQVFAEAQRLEESAPAAAEAKYRSLIEQAPNNAEFQIGLARSLLAQAQYEECQLVIDQLAKRGFLEPEAERVKASLELRGMQGVDVEALRTAAAAEPSNLAVQLQYAEALAGTQQYEAALQACLALVEQDKHGIGDSARQVMIDIFRVLPAGSELTSTYRRRLSTALY